MNLCRLANFRDNFLRRITQVVGRDDRQTAIGEDILALLHIGAFQAHHERHRQVHFFGRRNDTIGDDVAFHDATEDVHENTLNGGVFQNNLERGGDHFLRCAAADVEEVGGEFTV